MTDNSQAHQIRLAGPWQIDGDSSPTGRIKLPFVGAETAKPLVVNRGFNGSEGLLAATQVRLRIVFEGDPPRVELNGQHLNATIEGSASNHLEFEITAIVAKSNSLKLICGTQLSDQVTDASLLITE